MSRQAYPSDASDEEWDFVAPYLTLVKEDAPRRTHPLRELFNALRWFVRAGCSWRMLPNDLPLWTAVEQQARRWMRAGCLEAIAPACAWSSACSKNAPKNLPQLS